MSRRAAKKDSNHNAIAAHLRSIGFSVLDTSAIGRGFPDCLVGRAGFACLVEIKNPAGKGIKLTADEQRVRDQWTGPYLVVTSPKDAENKIFACCLRGDQ